MNNSPDGRRQIVQLLDQQFSGLLDGLQELARSVPQAVLYQHPPAVSVAENILRSAAVIEQTFGGLTTNLWDDPFEWTLPETLSDAGRITDYLNEVDEARKRAFSCFEDDAVLMKYVSAPSGELPLLGVLLEALVRSANHKGRAVATCKILSASDPTRFII